MSENNSHGPGLSTLVGRIARTGMGALRNRTELLSVEWQEERARLMELLVWSVVWLFFGFMGMALVTATVIFLFPEDKRLWAAGAFAALYILGAIAVWTVLKKRMQERAFTESLDQMRKDAAWLESLK